MTAPRLFAAMCTYHRPDDAVRSLLALASQDLRPELVVVVDNGSDPTTREVVTSAPLPVLYVDPGVNLGPAGGFHRALAELTEADDDDVVLLLDDDDPLPDDPSLVAALRDRLEPEAVAGRRLAGVAVRGGALDVRTGMVRSRPGSDSGLVGADHLHGCAFPLYRMGPLRRTDAFDPSLFWGFEELAAGRRLVAAGYELGVDADLLEPLVADREKFRRAGPTRRLAEPSWRHYYRHRNLLRVLRRERAWVGVAITVAVRLVGKPLVHLPVQPRRAWWHLRTNLAAVRDGLGAERRMVADGAHRPT